MTRAMKKTFLQTERDSRLRLGVSDNLPFLRRLNDGCVDLVCIDPLFVKNETFGRKNSKAPDPLKPPLSAERLPAAVLAPCINSAEFFRVPIGMRREV